MGLPVPLVISSPSLIPSLSESGPVWIGIVRLLSPSVSPSPSESGLSGSVLFMISSPSFRTVAIGVWIEWVSVVGVFIAVVQSIAVGVRVQVVGCCHCPSPSLTPSPSESSLMGLVPLVISSLSLMPSPSESGIRSGWCRC